MSRKCYIAIHEDFCLFLINSAIPIFFTKIAAVLSMGLRICCIALKRDKTLPKV